MNQVAGVPHNVENDFTIEGGKVWVSSRDVAARFDKEHRHVLRAIDGLIKAAPSVEPNFGRYSYIAENGKENPAYRMTRDGFTLLVMGFTGTDALQWKLKYIEAFNRMEAKIRTRELGPVEIFDKLPANVKDEVGGIVKGVVAKQIRDPEFIGLLVAAMAAVYPSLAAPPPPPPPPPPHPPEPTLVTAYQVVVNILGFKPTDIPRGFVQSVGSSLKAYCVNHGFKAPLSDDMPKHRQRRLLQREGVMEYLDHTGGAEAFIRLHRDLKAKQNGQGKLHLVVPKDDRTKKEITP